MSFASATIKAQVKQATGTGAARAERRAGRVPAVIYAKGNMPVMVALDSKELFLQYQKGRFFSRIMEVDTGDKKYTVLPQEVQMDPIKDIPVHADFLSVEAKSRIKVAVPMEFINHEKSPGLKRGGILNTVRRSIDVFCNADSIPEKFTADLNGLQIGGNIKWHNIKAPEGVEPVIRGRDFTIATVAGRMAEEEVAATAVAATAAVSAEGAAAAPAAGATPAAATAADAKKK